MSETSETETLIEIVFLNQSLMIRANTILKLHLYWNIYR